MDGSVVDSLPRLFAEDVTAGAVQNVDGEVFGKLVCVSRDAEARARFQGAVGFAPTLPPSKLQMEDSVLLQTNQQQRNPPKKEDSSSSSRVLVSIGTRLVMAWSTALVSDRVHFFDLVSGSWMEHLSLHSPLQRRVSALQFRRNASASDVLVACQRGLCVWNVRFHEKSAIPRLIESQSTSSWSSSSNDALAMDVSPDGLFAAVVSVSALCVYDLNAGKCLAFSGSFGASVLFSRDGAFLVVGSAKTGAVRVWATVDWSERVWVVPPGSSPSRIVGSYSSPLAVSYHVGGRFVSRLALDRCEEDDIYDGSYALPLPSLHAAMSPCGRRLAIVFEGGLVGIVDSGNLGTMMGLGSIRGEPEWGPAKEVFFRNSTVAGGGALLAIAWTSGVISFVEMLI